MNTEQKPGAIRLADNITASGHTEREAFEAWWRENVSQGLAEIDYDYRYWAIWQARASIAKATGAASSATQAAQGGEA